MKQLGIYKIENKITGKKYIGSSKNIKNRLYQHKRLLEKGEHHSIKLQNTYNKYGKDNFIFEIIESLDDEILLIEREQYWIDGLDTYNNGYNSRPIADSPLGTKCSEETKKKISEFHKKRKRKPHSEETKRKLSEHFKGKPSPNKGKKLSEETKKKISESKKGKPSGREGSKHSEETKKHLSEVRKGIKWNPDYVMSEETKKKISDTMKRKGIKPPSRKKGGD